MVADWPAPRGGRTADGVWRWSLATRPGGHFVNVFEQRSVAAYQAVAATLTAARCARGWTLRQCATETVRGFPATSVRGMEQRGLALSVVTGVEQGSSWPSFSTIAVMALVLDYRLQLNPMLPPAPHQVGVDAAAVEAVWSDFQVPHAAWQRLVVDQYARRLALQGWTKTRAARMVGLRKNTVSELWSQLPPFHWANFKTLSALASLLGARLEAVPRSAPWYGRAP